MSHLSAESAAVSTTAGSGCRRFYLAALQTITAVLLCVSSYRVIAGDLHVAVATNFLPTLEKLAPLFEETSGHQVMISSGSSGSLYAQITNGAPYDVFLSADEERPSLLAAQKPGSKVQPYATGRLALWWPGLDTITTDWKVVLKEGSFRHLAMANPKLAPYGMAANEVITAFQLDEKLENKLVLGENIGQAYALVASGNAQAGFVAWSQLVSDKNSLEPGTFALIPDEYHTAVLQTGIVVNPSPEAGQFMDFLGSKAAQALIVEDGYGFPAHE